MKKRKLKRYYIYSKERLMTKKDFNFYGLIIFSFGFLLALVLLKYL